MNLGFLHMRRQAPSTDHSDVLWHYYLFIVCVFHFPEKNLKLTYLGQRNASNGVNLEWSLVYWLKCIASGLICALLAEDASAIQSSDVCPCVRACDFCSS